MVPVYLFIYFNIAIFIKDQMSNRSFSACVQSMSKSKSETTELNLLYFPPKLSQGLNIYPLQFKDADGNIVSCPTGGGWKNKSNRHTNIPCRLLLLLSCLLIFSHGDARPFVVLVLSQVSKDDHVSEIRSQ